MSDLLPESEALRKMFKENPEKTAQLRGAVAAGRVRTIDELDPRERLTFLCVLWDHRSVAGCTRDKCQVCKQDVALSPSSVEAMQKRPGPADVLCMPCFATTLKETA